MIEAGFTPPEAPPRPGLGLDNQVMEANAAFAGAGIAMMTPICSPEFQAEHKLERPEQLLEIPRLSPQDVWWHDWLALVGVDCPDDTPALGLQLDNQVMEANAVRAGSGIALMTPMFWRMELATGRLVQPFPEILVTDRSHFLVYPEARRTQPKIAAFREWLLRQVREAARNEPAEIFAEPPPLS